MIFFFVLTASGLENLLSDREEKRKALREKKKAAKKPTRNMKGSGD